MEGPDLCAPVRAGCACVRARAAACPPVCLAEGARARGAPAAVGEGGKGEGAVQKPGWLSVTCSRPPAMAPPPLVTCSRSGSEVLAGGLCRKLTHHGAPAPLYSRPRSCPRAAPRAWDFLETGAPCRRCAA